MSKRRAAEALLTSGDVKTDARPQIHILYCNEDEAAVRFTNGDTEWLVIEENCRYEPMPFQIVNAQLPEAADPSYTGSFPFMTEADQTIIDLTNLKILQRSFSATEGEIQGLVYAVGAIMHGGTLDPESYELYIREMLIPPDFDVHAQLDPFKVEKMKRLVASKSRQ